MKTNISPSHTHTQLSTRLRPTRYVNSPSLALQHTRYCDRLLYPCTSFPSVTFCSTVPCLHSSTLSLIIMRLHHSSSLHPYPLSLPLEPHFHLPLLVHSLIVLNLFPPLHSPQHTRSDHLICFSSVSSLGIQYDPLASSPSIPSQASSVPFPACFCLPSSFIRFSLPFSVRILSPCCWSFSPHF